MRKLLLAVVFLLAACCWAATAADLRQSINFNREWKFELGDVAGADALEFADAKWERVGLPHSFSMPYFAVENFYVGYGWYRKHFDVPAVWAGKRINLEFDGVFQVAEIFVNGQRIGEHKGGYTGFTLDITDAVKPGDNVVAVRVNNLWNARLAPRAGEHTFSGGIYRDMRLVVTAPLHVAWCGTSITTPQVSKVSGTVNAKTEVVNDSGAMKNVTLKTSVLDANGNTVAQMESKQNIAAGATNSFDKTSVSILNPKLWSPEHPNLYSVQTIVLDAGKPVDTYTSPFGFRWFKFTADQGFFLNGEHYYFKGANVHQDHAGWGDAVADSGFFRDVKLVKDAGFDFIRGSHYPHAPAFAAACDQIGMLFWSENCFWGTGGFKNANWSCSAYPTNPDDEADFEASVKASLRDMIRINRNHPSIIVWSMSNEPFFSDKSVMPKVRRFLSDLVAFSHELDPTRPAAIGGCQRGNIDKIGDVAGYNGDGARLFANSGVASVVSEYGSTIADRPGKYEPGWGELSGTPGASKNEIGSWRLPWRSGEAIWCGFDHGSIAGRNFGAMGLVDYFRLPKRQWYWYRNDYLHIPPPAWPSNGIPAALKLTTDKTVLNFVDGTDDAQLIVTVVDKFGLAINNCPPVTLAIESGPGEFPTGPSITFAPDSDIAIRDGEAAMEFRSYYAGKTVIRATSPGLKDATIEITSLGGSRFIAGKTPPVQARPYVRFAESTVASKSVTLGLENPTRASSEAKGHSGRLANDGNPATFWQAAVGDTNAWWQVDLERMVAVQTTKLKFPVGGDWRYKIEISDDGEASWKMVSEQFQNASGGKTQIQPAVNSAHGRFLRVAFVGTPDGKPAALAEVEVTGNIKFAMTKKSQP